MAPLPSASNSFLITPTIWVQLCPFNYSNHGRTQFVIAHTDGTALIMLIDSVVVVVPGRFLLLLVQPGWVSACCQWVSHDQKWSKALAHSAYSKFHHFSVLNTAGTLVSGAAMISFVFCCCNMWNIGLDLTQRQELYHLYSRQKYIEHKTM